MLLRSGDNLFDESKRFIEENAPIKLFSPFIRVNMLKRLDVINKVEQIIVRWQLSDILYGVTDFEELFQFCVDNNIELYRNQNIHLKVFQAANGKIHFGSANTTNKGLGEKNYNLELSGVSIDSQLIDKVYLQRIIQQSQHITSELFKTLKKEVDEKRRAFTAPKAPEFSNVIIEKDKFLLSALPMSESPKDVSDIYLGVNDEFEKSQVEFAIHDIANFEISSDLKNENEFFEELKSKFNQHPFIYKLKNAIKSKHNHYMGFSEMAIWISENCSNRPNPRRWDIKDSGIIGVLHNWIPYFDADFKSELRHEFGGGSDRIIYSPSNNSLIEIIEGLNRDVATGNKAPHQIVMLISLYQLSKGKNAEFSTDQVVERFKKDWKNYENQGFLNQYTMNAAMPLNALRKSELIAFSPDFISDKSNYRRIAKILDTVKKVQISGKLLNAMENIGSLTLIESYLTK